MCERDQLFYLVKKLFSHHYIRLKLRDLLPRQHLFMQEVHIENHPVADESNFFSSVWQKPVEDLSHRH